ncbi:unnamed protein product [Dicrocoelium dendriticum]|nr:unnamed protein product [Dicrocoelium dendriticum]
MRDQWQDAQRFGSTSTISVQQRYDSYILTTTGANLSRLRSPRVWTSDGTTTNPSPPPYTPPPMLSPNRPGSGLFSSLTKWCSTVSPVRPGALFNRRSSSHCPSSAVSASSDLLRRRSNISSTRVHSLNTCDEPEGTSLKRNYTSSFVRSSNAHTAGSTYSSRDSVDEHGRVFAFSSRRHRKTPKSAPVVMLDSSSIAAPSHSSQEHAPDASCELPAVSKTGATTVFGYDDETMRRFAEADAADRARWYQTVPRDPSDPLIDYPECLSSGLDEVPEKLCKLEQPDGDTSMNYQSEDALVLVEDPLAVLDERAIEMGAYVDEDQLMEDEEEEEEGVPSSLVPRINIGDAFQAEIPELSTDRASDLEKNTEPRETLLWYPANLDEKDPKNIESCMFPIATLFSIDSSLLTFSPPQIKRVKLSHHITPAVVTRARPRA